MNNFQSSVLRLLLGQPSQGTHGPLVVTSRSPALFGQGLHRMYLCCRGKLLHNRALDCCQLQSLQKPCNTCLDLWRMHCTSSAALAYRSVILSGSFVLSRRVPTGILKGFSKDSQKHSLDLWRHYSCSLQNSGSGHVCSRIFTYAGNMKRKRVQRRISSVQAGLAFTSAKISTPGFNRYILLWRRLAQLLLNVFGCMTEPRLQ